MEKKEYLENAYKEDFERALELVKERKLPEARKALEGAGKALVELTPLTSGIEKEKCLMRARALAQLINDVKEREKRDIEAEKSNESTMTPSDTDEVALEKALSDLNGLEGLEHLKEEVNYFVQMLRFNRERSELGLNVANFSLHMVIMGEDTERLDEAIGIIARIYYALRALKKAQVVKISVDDVLSEQRGYTYARTEAKLSEAMGGIAYIKEPYSAENGEIEREIGDAIYRYIAHIINDETVFIIAGKEEKMEKFLTYKFGIKCHIPHTIRI